MKEQEMLSHTAAGHPGGPLLFRRDCSGMNSRAASRSCHMLCGQKQQILLIFDRQSDHQTWQETNVKCKIYDSDIVL